MFKYTNYKSSVAQTNTPETDAMDKVLHIVEFRENGIPKNVQLLATDPMDAISKVQVDHNIINIVEGNDGQA